MADGNLFGVDLTPVAPDSSESAQPASSAAGRRPRLIRGDRQQMMLEARCLDDELPKDHRARTLWEATGHLDLSEFSDAVKSVEAGPGRPAIDPRILLVLWLYATAEAVGSARCLSRLCEESLPYRWIAGGLSICHRVLSGFRIAHGEKMDSLLTQLLAAMMKAKVITLRQVAQDGTKVRAHAGAASFRRKKSLRQCLKAAEMQIEALRDHLDREDETTDKRKEAAKRRAAEKREKDVLAALQALEEVQETKRRNNQDESTARASTTDPDARNMKMADGGTRPAYNVQLVADVDSRLILVPEVTNAGNDVGQLDGMLEEIERRTGGKPQEYLADGGYMKKDSIQALEQAGVEVILPPPKTNKTQDPNKRQRKHPPEIERWKRRMETPEAAEKYKARAATIETINGELKAHRGFTQVLVRGFERVRAVTLLQVLTYNLLQSIRLAPHLFRGQAA